MFGRELFRFADLGNQELEEGRLLQQNTQVAKTSGRGKVIPAEQNLRRLCLRQPAAFGQIGLRIAPNDFLREGHRRLRCGRKNLEVRVTLLCNEVEQEACFRRRIVGRHNRIVRHTQKVPSAPFLIGTPHRIEVLCLLFGTPSEDVDRDSFFLQRLQIVFNDGREIGNAGHDNAL